MSSDLVKYLAITDLETTGLDLDADPVVEVATILVDMELNEVGRFERVIRLTDYGLSQIRRNEFVLKMHEKSGLLSDALLSENKMADVQTDWKRFLYMSVENADDQIAVAGSGVGHFDFERIKRYFPEVAKQLVYYPYDIGDFRRMTTWWNGGESVIPPIEESFVEGVKAHRAMADAQAHYEEFKAYRAWFDKLPKVDVTL